MQLTAHLIVFTSDLILSTVFWFIQDSHLRRFIKLVSSVDLPHLASPIIVFVRPFSNLHSAIVPQELYFSMFHFIQLLMALLFLHFINFALYFPISISRILYFDLQKMQFLKSSSFCQI
jgi:hypothetical protein